jgi:hypothetical protein
MMSGISERQDARSFVDVTAARRMQQIAEQVQRAGQARDPFGRWTVTPQPAASTRNWSPPTQPHTGVFDRTSATGDWQRRADDPGIDVSSRVAP